MKIRAVVASFILCFMPGLAFAVEPPAALVMAVSGSTTPAVAAMSEIPSGAPLRLAPGAELTLLHYARCKMVTVTGGTVTVTRTDLVTDGTIIAEVDAPCPRVHQLSANAPGTVSGGLVMRGLSAAPRWPLNREIVLAGNGTDRLKAAAIYAEGRPDAPLVRLDVSGHQARFPAGLAPLAVNARYVLRLTMGERAEPVDISFIGGPTSGPSLLVVLHGQ
jgi:hypothetical protein